MPEEEPQWERITWAEVGPGDVIRIEGYDHAVLATEISETGRRIICGGVGDATFTFEVDPVAEVSVQRRG